MTIAEVDGGPVCSVRGPIVFAGPPSYRDLRAAMSLIRIAQQVIKLTIHLGHPGLELIASNGLPFAEPLHRR
jgi:hypothetical protein